MNTQAWVEATLSAFLVISNIVLLGFTYKNMKQIKELSSPKPFLKPVGMALDKFAPVISIQNFGSGHAVNVSMKVMVNIMKPEEKLSEWVKYTGDNVIPFTNGIIDRVDYRYTGDKIVALPEELKIEIGYESDSGAKGNMTWLRNDKGFQLISGR